MKQKLMVTLVIGLFFAACNAWAQESFQLGTLQQLFEQYKRQQAYDYARQHLDEMAGDPYFDYYYGVSAIDTGHASEGVFALERVLLVFPDDHVARLELARGYYILEEYARARKEFEKVLEAKPPKGVRETTQAFLDRIRLKEGRYRTTSDGFVELAMGSDSNVNSAPGEDDLILLPSLGIQLDASSLSQDDTFTDLTAAWQITHPFAPGWMLNGAVTAKARQNQDFDQFDTTTLTLQGGVSRLLGQSRYKAGLIAQQFDLDGEDYRDLTGLNLEWRYALSQKSNITSTLQYASLEYDTLSSKNSDLMTLGVNYSHGFSGRFSPTVFGALSIGAEAADENTSTAQSDTERDILGARLGVVLSLSSKLALQTAVGWQNSQYAEVHPTLLLLTARSEEREDDYITADVNLLWLFHKNWRLDTKLAYSENSSNVEIYTYDRTVVSLNLNYAF